MGVEFFPCSQCGDTICDAGSYYRCNDNCERRWCSYSCREKEDYYGGNDTCGYCRQELATDSTLLYYMLNCYGLKREQVLEEWKRRDV